MQSRLKRTLLLVTILCLLLTSCQTNKGAKEIEIPELKIEVERPTLDAIPTLDTEGWTQEQIEAVSEVLSVYNMNLGKLVIYAQALEKAYKVKIDYLNNVLTIITSSY